MKKYIKLLIVAIAVVAVSCDKGRLDTPPTGNTEASFFQTTLQFRENLVIVYAKLYDYYFFDPDFNFANCPSSLWLLPGDDLTETQGARTAEELFDGSMNPNNFRITFYFQHLYQLIARANVLIEKTETVDTTGFEGSEEIPQMKGEALFLRGFAYFRLFDTYGSVPIVTGRILLQSESNTPKSDELEVLGQAISDARAAIDLLPESWPPKYTGRATKNSARALLMKALIFRANYGNDNADLTEALSVYNSIDAELVPTYTDNFNAFTENNMESLFEIQGSMPTAGDNIFLSNDGPWRGVECMSIFRGCQTENGTTAANFAPTKYIITDKLLNRFGTDPRISVFLRADDGFEGKLFQKYTLTEMDSLVPFHDNSVNNERVLRFADLKLLAAEADLKTGNPGAAISELNDIRARARTWALDAGLGDGTVPADLSTSETGTGTIMQWIMDERFVELAGEGHRWNDLRRWHASGDIDLTGWDGSEANFSTHLASPVKFDVNKHLLFPLPQDEVDRNSEITSNNPGY